MQAHAALILVLLVLFPSVDAQAGGGGGGGGDDGGGGGDFGGYDSDSDSSSSSPTDGIIIGCVVGGLMLLTCACIGNTIAKQNGSYCYGRDIDRTKFTRTGQRWRAFDPSSDAARATILASGEPSYGISLATTRPLTLKSGTVSGYYIDAGPVSESIAEYPTSFTLEVDESAHAITGSGRDGIGDFTLRGHYRPETAHVIFLKTYSGNYQHGAQIELTLQRAFTNRKGTNLGDCLVGQWLVESIRDVKWRNTFVLTTFPGKSEHSAATHSSSEEDASKEHATPATLSPNRKSKEWASPPEKSSKKAAGTPALSSHASSRKAPPKKTSTPPSASASAHSSKSHSHSRASKSNSHSSSAE